MSKSIFETFTDEHGNVSVRVSQEVQVLTNEEADRIAEEYKRLKDKNAKLRELVRDMVMNMGGCALHGNPLRLREFEVRAKELGVIE